MFRPVFLYIGLRYTRAKRRNHFISFISLMSMLGIALGIMVLITVLSVMNGFDQQIKQRVFAMVPQVTVTSLTGALSHWKPLQHTLKEYEGVEGIAPFISGEALISANGLTQASVLTGIDPVKQASVSVITETLTAGSMSSLKAGSFHMVVGQAMANHFGLRLGSKVTVITPQGNLTPLGFMPRFKRFTVSGIFHAGDGFGFDSSYVFVSLEDAATLYQLGDRVTGLRLKITDPFQAPQFINNLQSHLPISAEADDWTSQFGAFFDAIALEKHMMFLILMLIIAVAAFNLVSTLVMVVNEKSADIAILRTLGATPRLVMGIFIVQGGVVGLMGTLIGVISGVIVSLNITALTDWLQQVFHVQFISASVYIVDYLPSHIEYMDVVRIAIAALILSLLATLYPAWRASRIQIVEALRYE